MKKILAILLIAVCLFGLVACDGQNGNNDKEKECVHEDKNGDGLCDLCGVTTDASAAALYLVNNMYANSKPTKSVITTKVEAGKVFEGKYEMVSGHIDGKKATVYSYEYPRVTAVEDDTELGTKNVIGHWVYLEGTGLCTRANVANRVWDPEGADPADGMIALDFDAAAVSDVKYENHTLTFTIPASSALAILGSALETADATNPISVPARVTVMDDGAAVTSVKVQYTVPEQTIDAGESQTETITQATVPAQKVIITATYSYDLELISID